MTFTSDVCVQMRSEKWMWEKWMTEEHIISPLIRDLSEVMEGKDGGGGGGAESKSVLKANINNTVFYNELSPLFSIFACIS